MADNKPIVVDDFCHQVDLVVQSAHAAGFSTWLPNKGVVGSSKYEGMGFVGYHVFMLRSLVDALGEVILPNEMFFRYTNPGMEKAYIHSDREYGAHTAVVYLTDHEEEYGTAFYRHIPTGLIHMPSFEEMEAMGILEQMKEDMVSRDPDKWEQIDFVQGKKNRAVIFKAPLFHSRIPVEGIGTDSTDGRLVWVSHFYKLKGDGDLY